MSAPKPPLRAYLLAFTTIYLVWGSTYLAIRIGVETMPPFAMAALRFLIAGTLLMAFLRLQGVGWPTPRQWRDAAVCGMLLIVGGNGLVSWAEQTVPSGLTALLIGASPLFIVLANWSWPGGQRPSGVTFAAMACGLGGVAWLAAPWETKVAGGMDPAGITAILLSCVSWALGAVYGRHMRDPAPPFTAAAAQMLIGSIGLGLIAWAHGDLAAWQVDSISARSWLALIYLTLVGSLVGYTTFVWLIKHTTPALASTYAYVNPVVAVFLGWLLLDEMVTSRTLVASAIILGSVIVISLHNRHVAKN